MSANDLLARFAPRSDAPARPPAAGDTVQESGHDEAPGDAFRCMRGGHKATGLRFIFLGGGDFTMPYGYMPSTWRGPENSILIEYPQFTVHLKGRNLDELRNKVDEHRVSQVREIEEMHAKSLSIVVTHIQVVGWFPSKQVLALGRVSGQWPQPVPIENKVEPLHAHGRESRAATTGKGGAHG